MWALNDRGPPDLDWLGFRVLPKLLGRKIKDLLKGRAGKRPFLGYVRYHSIYESETGIFLPENPKVERAIIKKPVKERIHNRLHTISAQSILVRAFFFPELPNCQFICVSSRRPKFRVFQFFARSNLVKSRPKKR